MADKSLILDQWGRPIDKAALTREKAGPTLTGVRTVLTGYPGDGLTPQRLAGILRAADQGDPLRYLELAETVEERDLHYVGVLGTRKRSVAQLDVTVEAAGDDAASVEHADLIREWLKRDELQDELFDMLDAVGKGYSVTEIVWDSSEGQFEPKRLEYRDPRFFTFDKRDGATPLLRAETGDEPLDPFKYVVTRIRAKSGLPIRSGLARLAVWAWMFKAFTQRDWAIFTQTFGQPVRVGKYGPGASEADKDTLFRAVANIAGDCAAIIPESMLIEFVESKNVGQGSDLYLKRCDWIDQQISKAVLGQTGTTDAIAGGYAVGKTHRNVQEDIERSDAKAAAACLNRDLVVPMVALNHGPQRAYPKIKIGREESIELQLLVDAVKTFVPMGLRVESSVIADKLGLPDPPAEAKVLTPPAAAAADPEAEPGDGKKPPAAPKPKPPAATKTALQAQQLQETDAIDAMVDRIIAEHGFELMAPIVAGLEQRLAKATSIEEATKILVEQLATMDVSKLSETLARADFAAAISGAAQEPLS
jgi:phage gp29-like protein